MSLRIDTTGHAAQTGRKGKRYKQKRDAEAREAKARSLPAIRGVSVMEKNRQEIERDPNCAPAPTNLQAYEIDKARPGTDSRS
jgi:hypothetical protein